MGSKTTFICWILLGLVQICMFSVSTRADQLFENSRGSPIFSLVENAKKSIQMEIYTMTDSTIKQEIKNAIDRGVKVQIIEESAPVGAACKVFQAGSVSDTAECAEEKSLLNYVKAHGGTYVPFPKSLCGTPNSNCFQHGKMALIDQTTAVISTGNMDSTSLCDAADNTTSCDRDFTVTTTDASIIKGLNTVFENDLVSATTAGLATLNSRLTVSPDSMTPITQFIASAKNSLLVENQYLEDPTMNQAILDAAKRGVKVSVIVASACSFGKPTASSVKRWTTTYTAFDAAGIKTWIFTGKMLINGKSGYLHAKTMVADGTRAWVGSVNGSTTSLSDNREYGIFLNDTSLVSQLSNSIEADIANPLGETWQDSVACAHDNIIRGSSF